MQVQDYKPWPNWHTAGMLRGVSIPENTPPASPRTRAPSFDPEIARAVGAAVRRWREEQGIAQDAFALRAGVDRSYFGRLERGQRQPTVALLLRIAAALGVRGSELLAEAEDALAKGARSRKSEN
jgi:XRE family transcriptional regulator, regulator of sulfur utilization